MANIQCQQAYGETEALLQVQHFQPFWKIIHSQFLVKLHTQIFELPSNSSPQRNFYSGLQEDTDENEKSFVCYLWKWKVEDPWGPQS